MHRYQLVPELESFEREIGGEETPVSWASSAGNFSLAVAYASLVWPRFFEVRGMVFRGAVEAIDVDRWLADLKHDRKAVEATLNHLHILDVQSPGNWEQVTDAQLCFIGETLKASWSAKLAVDFPGRDFVVEFQEGTSSNRRDYQVSFHENRLPDAPEN